MSANATSPPPLKPGDTVILAAPARAVEPKVVRAGKAFFENQGYRALVMDNALEDEYDPVLEYFAGPDDARVRRMNEALAHPDAKAVCCLTGGYGVTRILSKLDYAALENHPKWICGFSDITALHMAVYAETGLPSLHSPNVDVIPMPDIARDAWLAALRGNPTGLSSPLGNRFTENNPAEAWSPGRAEGVLLGGNLTLVSALAGTPHFPAADGGIVLFLEDVGEFAYRVDLMLTQLWQTGLFERVSGLILGQFTRRSAQEGEPEGLLEEVLRSFCRKLGIPVLANFPIGHVGKNLTVVHGARVGIGAEPPSFEYV